MNRNFARISTMLLSIFAAGWATYPDAVLAQSATTFTYQGELQQNGNLANGSFNMEFQLWNSASGGTQLDTMTINGVPVSNGRFTVQFAYGQILTDGTIISSSQNITGVALLGANKYGINFAGGLNASDIVVATPRQAVYIISTVHISNGQLEIACYNASQDNFDSRADIQFVVYRP